MLWFGVSSVVPSLCPKIHVHGLLESIHESGEGPLVGTSCSICLDAYSQKNNIWSTGCGHLYHKRCINACINVSKIRYSPKPTPVSRSRH